MENKIKSFQELDVYKRLYESMLLVVKEVIPHLPPEERFSLSAQMLRACKSPIAILAEGYARKNYKKDWLKYINEAIGECNEMIVHLTCSRDLYPSSFDARIINNLIKEYDISGKQLYCLAKSWNK